MKKNNLLILAAVAPAIMMFSTLTMAETESTDFKVLIKIEDSCDAGALSAEDLDFGTHAMLVDEHDENTTMTISCTKGADVDIAMEPQSTGSDDGTGYMTGGPDNEEIDYTLYQDNSHSEAWGGGSNKLSYTGIGKEDTLPIYGQTKAGQQAAAGDYEDTVTVTIDY